MVKRLIVSVIVFIIVIKLVSLFSPEFATFLVSLVDYLLNGLIKVIQWLQHLIRVFLRG